MAKDSTIRLVTGRHREDDGTTVILFECGHSQRYVTPPEDEIEAECAHCAADALAGRPTRVDAPAPAEEEQS